MVDKRKPRKEVCTHCKREWNISIKQNIPREGYTCPYCSSKLREGGLEIGRANPNKTIEDTKSVTHKRNNNTAGVKKHKRSDFKDGRSGGKERLPRKDKREEKKE